MQCLRVWFTIWLCAISVNHSVASPVDTLNVDNKIIGDLIPAESKQDERAVSERENEVGYLRKADEKGADAYQHFESFHDKDGDAYGYEKHEAFGKSNKGESLNDGKDTNEGNNYNYVQELGDKAKYQKYQGHNDDPGKSQHNNYYYSYNSEDDDDDDKKPYFSSNYREETKKDVNSGEDENDDNNSTDEEKTTNFSFKIVSDDYAEDDADGDVKSEGNGNGKGYGYHFGHGDKNTDVDYSVKKSDYTVGDDSDDDGNEDEGEDESSEEEDDGKVVSRNQKLNNDQGKPKDTKSYSSYTTFSSQEGDKEDDDDDDDDDEEEEEEEENEKPAAAKNKPIQKQVIRYENTHPKKQNSKHSNKIVTKDDSEENNKTKDGGNGHVKADVELHQPAKPRPTQEYRTQYLVQNIHTQSTPQTSIQPSKPTVTVQEHRSGYKIEESSGDKAADDDDGKGHAGSVTSHLYEIYVTHDSGKSNGGGGGGDGDGGDAKGSEDDGGDDNGKSGKLVVQKAQNLSDKTNSNDNGAYNVNINYGKKTAPKKNGKKSYRKRKGNLKKKKIIKPHKYEVEEYTDSEDGTKQSAVAGKGTSSPQHRESIVAGKASSPQHHRDSDDYSNGQQFLFASEADSDAYYW